MAYLYGASIQGIQGFIFESNELKNIIGASEIVKKFDEINFLHEPFSISKEPTVLLQAAGNIRLKIDNKDDIEKIALHFPKHIMKMAYGITVSQAVVDIEKANRNNEDLRDLLEKYLKIQRNKVSLPLDMSINMMQLEKKNARAILYNDKKSTSTTKKIESYDNYFRASNYTIVDDISDLSNSKNKIAIIHADGNGLGDIVRHYTGSDMSEFSASLQKATENAFNKAKEVFSTSSRRIYREVILGGDDLTLICHADYALEFTKRYLAEFQAETKELLTQYNKSIDLENYTGELTACAGIAFCNKNYPFHYAVDLAEELCKYAKNSSNRKKSCLMFHNIQGSHSDSYQKYIDDELIVHGKHPIYFNFGPYYLTDENYPSIKQLQDLFSLFSKEASPLSSIRNWIEELYRNKAHADTLLKRIKENYKNTDWEKEFHDCFYDSCHKDSLMITKGSCSISPMYDILQLKNATQEVCYG